MQALIDIKYKKSIVDVAKICFELEELNVM